MFGCAISPRPPLINSPWLPGRAPRPPHIHPAFFPRNREPGPASRNHPNTNFVPLKNGIRKKWNRKYSPQQAFQPRNRPNCSRPCFPPPFPNVNLGGMINQEVNFPQPPLMLPFLQQKSVEDNNDGGYNGRHDFFHESNKTAPEGHVPNCSSPPNNTRQITLESNFKCHEDIEPRRDVSLRDEENGVTLPELNSRNTWGLIPDNFSNCFNINKGGHDGPELGWYIETGSMMNPIIPVVPRLDENLSPACLQKLSTGV